MKFVAIVCGIDAAHYSCVWCKCSSADRWDMSNITKGARTNNEIEEYCKLPKDKRFGCRISPIFKFIPIDHCIIDSLHLFFESFRFANQPAYSGPT